ncbi:MAG: hypothetical protein GY749_37690, partial [Desulfobacteraceae bacterium]|nr:hypothetical protein [Desulfobacteraceae bacterium]
RLEVTHAMTGALNLLEFLQGKDVTLPEDEALTLPRFVSDHDDSTIVMFLDEFQNTRMPSINSA